MDNNQDNLQKINDLIAKSEKLISDWEAESSINEERVAEIRKEMNRRISNLNNIFSEIEREEDKLIGELDDLIIEQIKDITEE